eukprot:Em0022g607a
MVAKVIKCTTRAQSTIGSPLKTQVTTLWQPGTQEGPAFFEAVKFALAADQGGGGARGCTKYKESMKTNMIVLTQGYQEPFRKQVLILEKNQEKIVRRLNEVVEKDTNTWLVIFPEETKFDPRNHNTITTSQEQAMTLGIPKLNHVLSPRTTRFELVLTHIKRHFKAAYDVTIMAVIHDNDIIGRLKVPLDANPVVRDCCESNESPNAVNIDENPDQLESNSASANAGDECSSLPAMGPYDLGALRTSFSSGALSDQDKYKVLKQFDQPQGYRFPAVSKGGQLRRFQASWFVNYPCLEAMAEGHGGHRRSEDKEPLVEETERDEDKGHGGHGGHEHEEPEKSPSPVDNQPLPPLTTWTGVKAYYKRYKHHLWIGKNYFLTCCIVVAIFLLSTNVVHEAKPLFITLNGSSQVNESYMTVNTSNRSYVSDRKSRDLGEDVQHWNYVTLSLYGPFEDSFYQPRGHNATVLADLCQHYVFICQGNVTMLDCPDPEGDAAGLNCQSVKIVNREYTTVKRTLSVDHSHHFHVDFFSTNEEVQFQVKWTGEMISEIKQVVISIFILVFVYLLIGFELADRALAAIIGSTATLATLAMLHKRPSLEEVISWINTDTICLLVGMMMLVDVFSQTGLLDYFSVKACKVTKGKKWPLVMLLCTITAVVSALLDNVTTFLLLTPVTFRLSKILDLDLGPLLIAEVLFSNVGGTATAIGDPPVVIMVGHKRVKEAGITFAELTAHLLIGTFFIMFVAYATLYITYSYCFKFIKPLRSSTKSTSIPVPLEEPSMSQLAEGEVELTAASKLNEDKIERTSQEESSGVAVTPVDVLMKNLNEMELKYKKQIKKHFTLLIQTTAVIGVVVVMFFVSSLVGGFELDLGWIALFGAITLIILSEQDVKGIFSRLELDTLLFFAALFIMMEGLTELGLIDLLGKILIYAIQGVPIQHQAMVAIILVLWVSALVSAFTNNIPFTTAMIPVVFKMAESSLVCLPLKPLLWSLGFGACLGGNASLAGAAANVVCAGISKRHGYYISFGFFLKIGIPMMLTTTFASMIYLLIAHVAIPWNARDISECMVK